MIYNLYFQINPFAVLDLPVNAFDIEDDFKLK